MKNPLNIRQNFYQGQSVSATNLTQLQDYSDNARNLIVSDILGYGIVSGFDTTKAKVNNFTLSIGSGLAYTKNGVRLETTAPKELFIKDFIKSTDLPSGETIITRYLAMSLDYDKDKPFTDSFSNSILTEWTPTATPVLYTQAELITMNDILLAEIQINEYGTTDIIDRKKDFLDFNALTQKTSSFTTTKEEANTIASIDADIFKINDKPFTDIIKDTSYPIKSTYTQYPNDTTGKFDETETPLALFGGDWEEIEKRIYNNVPEQISNKFGTTYKYPCSKLEFHSTNLFNSNIVTYPIPFTHLPTTSMIWGSNRAGTERVGTFNAVHTTETRIYGLTTSKCTVNLDGALSEDYIQLLQTGHWKDPADPISAEDEKNYVIIWKRI